MVLKKKKVEMAKWRTVRGIYIYMHVNCHQRSEMEFMFKKGRTMRFSRKKPPPPPMVIMAKS